MSNPVQVANKALSLVGGELIISFDDDTTEAIVVKAAFDMVRDKVLEDRQWTFASSRMKLTPDAIPPDFGYTYRFLIPSNVIRIFNADKLSGNNDLMWEREGDYILCDSAEIQIKFVERIDDVSKWTPSAVDCFSYLLASEIAMPLTESTEKVAMYANMYSDRLVDAGATDGSQGRAEQLRSRALMRGR